MSTELTDEESYLNTKIYVNTNMKSPLMNPGDARAKPKKLKQQLLEVITIIHRRTCAKHKSKKLCLICKSPTDLFKLTSRAIKRQGI